MNSLVNRLDKPYKYHVLYTTSKGNRVQRLTNDIHTATSWCLRYDGVIYEDVRYEGRLRLYNYVNRIR